MKLDMESSPREKKLIIAVASGDEMFAHSNAGSDMRGTVGLEVPLRLPGKTVPGIVRPISTNSFYSLALYFSLPPSYGMDILTPLRFDIDIPLMVALISYISY